MVSTSIALASIALAVGVVCLAFGVYALTTGRTPPWARRARWKPFGWANIFAFAFITTLVLSQTLGTPSRLRMPFLVLSMGFLTAQVVLSFIAYLPGRER